MNTGKKIRPSLPILVLGASALLSALTLTQLMDNAQAYQIYGVGMKPQSSETSHAARAGRAITPPGEAPGAAAGQTNVAIVADPAVDTNDVGAGDESVSNRAPSLVELIEFYSLKYFKFALDLLFRFLNSLGIFLPDDLASNLRP